MKALSVKPIWIPFDEYYKHTQNIKAAVYAFCFSVTKPKDHEWPHQVESVFYIGESGTKEPIIDRKNKNKPNKGKVEYAVHKRMKNHMHNMLNANKKGSSSNEKWREIFNDKYGYGKDLISGTLTDDRCWLCLLICPEDIKYPKSWLKRVEQELIDEYLNSFDDLPLLNLKERNSESDSLKKENSLSQLMIKKMKEQDITQFMR
jgi:hypothetical protein